MHLRRRPLGVLAVVALLLLAALGGHAQELLQLGEMSYARASAPYLQQPVVRTASFFRGVGGVAFEAVAEGENNLVVQSMKYDPTAIDGERLVVVVGRPDGTGQRARGAIHDWQLVPIARFADDQNGSAMTLFGHLDDKKAQKELLEARNRIINYHPALDNTLVGLRLFHADILIIQPNAIHLFQSGGRTVLGAGEAGHDPGQNRGRFVQIAEWQQERRRLGRAYRSYVVGDLDQRVTFTVRDGRLEFTGTPYWHAWKAKHDSAEARAKGSELITRHNQLVGSHNELARELNSRGASMPSGDREARRVRLQTMKVELQTIKAEIEELNSVESMPEFSRALSEKIRSLDGINPIVYRTLTTVMHYRALFRHYRARDARGFSEFLASLQGVPVEPSVTTPTIQYQPRP